MHSPSASMIAGLVAFDAMALFAELRGIPVSGDGLAWLNGCESVDRPVLAELVVGGGQAGMTVLLSTTSDVAAASLAADVNVVAIHQLADPAAAGLLAARARVGDAGAPGGADFAGQAGLARPAAAAGAIGPAASAAVPGAAGPPTADGGIGHGGRAVPAWAQRMPVPAAAGSPAAGTSAAVQGLAGDHPVNKNGSPAITAESLLRLPAGAFALIVKGPERRLLPRCQSVPARVPGVRA